MSTACVLAIGSFSPRSLLFGSRVYICKAFMYHRRAWVADCFVLPWGSISVGACSFGLYFSLFLFPLGFFLIYLPTTLEFHF